MVAGDGDHHPLPGGESVESPGAAGALPSHLQVGAGCN